MAKIPARSIPLPLRRLGPSLLLAGAGLVAIVAALAWHGPVHPAALNTSTIVAVGVPVQATAGQPFAGKVGSFTDQVVDREDVFVLAAYREFLRREIASTELAVLQTPLATPAQREAFVLTLFGSQEYRDQFVRDLVDGLLGRTATGADLATYGGIFQSQGGAAALGAVLASGEYFDAFSGGTNSGWVTAIYQDILNRAVSPSELASTVAGLDGGTLTRSQAVTSLLGSGEYRQLRIGDLYPQLLGRAVDATAIATSTAVLNTTGRWENVIAAIAGSTEYFNRRQPPAYGVTITWGDGGTSTTALPLVLEGEGIVALAAAGAFDVVGAHTYANAGAYQLSVKLDANYGSTATFTTSAQVSAPGGGSSPPDTGGGGGQPQPLATNTPLAATPTAPATQTPAPTQSPSATATSAPVTPSPAIATTPPATAAPASATAEQSAATPVGTRSPAPPSAGTGRQDAGPIRWGVAAAGLVAMCAGIGGATLRRRGGLSR
jgi:hypothetical protein